MLFSLPLLLNLASANDDGLHLLQVHAHVHTAKQQKPEKPLNPEPANANTPIYALKKRHPKFGPDGTWATPYCKSLLGCNPYCVDGCDGVAYWEASRAPPGLGAAGREEYNPNHPGAHFISCIPGDKGRGRPPTPDYNIKTMGGNVQCSGSENSTKKPFWHKSIMTTAQKDELKIAWGVNDAGVAKEWNSGGWIGDGHGWGNEYCPAGCVNDCAEFKMGGFLSCGYSPHGGESGWFGYNGQRNNAGGPNVRCPANVVSGTGHQAWTWCGEPKVETPEDFVCDLCEDSDNDFDPAGKKGKCEKINANAQKSVKRCEKRKNRPGVIKRCCPDPPVECPLCPDGKEFNPDNLDGKCAKLEGKATKNQEVCDKIKGRKKVQRKCCEEPAEEKTPDDFALTKANECAEGTKPVDYKTCHDQAANYQWPGQKPGHTQRWDEEGHDPEFGTGWTFMPPGCVLYVGWRGDSHEAQVRWNPNQNGKNDGNRALVCEKESAPDDESKEEPKCELGEGQPGKGIWGGTNCGFREPQYGGSIPFSASCTRLLICEAKAGCVAKGITSPETCMAAVEKEDNCEKDFFEWRTSLGSHCFCNPKGRTWVPYTGYAPSVTYPMKC